MEVKRIGTEEAAVARLPFGVESEASSSILFAKAHCRDGFVPFGEQLDGQRLHGLQGRWRVLSTLSTSIDPVNRQAEGGRVEIGHPVGDHGVQYSDGGSAREGFTQAAHDHPAV